MRKKTLITGLKLVSSVAICLAVGVIGAFFTTTSLDGWYSQIDKPSFNPPDALFGPVWTILYIMMGFAAFIVWQKGLSQKAVRFALGIFCTQLLLNGIWTPLFFGLQSPLAGLIDISLLWFAIVATIIAFKKVSHLSAALLIPYLLWVSFALVLNASIFAMN